MSELIDLTEFMKEGSGAGPVKLEWLDVDEKAYQEADRLPKQNFDIVPELQALWAHDDRPVSPFVPNTGEARTMGDLSQAHGPIRGRAPSELLIRTARLALMQTTDPQRIAATLRARFDPDTIRAASTELSSVFAERGLLGRHYIAAADFADCNSGSRKASDFVRQVASSARFVVQKAACGDCRHRNAGAGNVCSVFHKTLVGEAPYSDTLADQTERDQRAQGKAVQASQGSARDRIRAAHLSAVAAGSAQFSGHQQPAPKALVGGSTEEHLIAVASLTRKKNEDAKQVLAAQAARPIISMIRKELLRGRSGADVVTALRLAFDKRDLQATQAEWAPLFKQAGLYGAVYLTQDSFDDCREGADFVAKHGSLARAIVAGAKCDSCVYSKIGRCLMYGRPLIASPEEVLTAETVAAVVLEHKTAGRLPAVNRVWGDTPATALRAIHAAAMQQQPMAVSQQSLRATVEQTFRGWGPQVHETGERTKRTIVQAAQRYLNEGLYGQELIEVLRKRFEVRDLAAARAELKPVLAEQGLQGLRYIDPSIYDDYGAGCHEAARLHRSRAAVQYAKVGEKCASCVHQAQPGVCSVLSKRLVVEPPYVDKVAEQRAVLASGRSTHVAYESLINNGLSMMEEFQLQHGDGSFDLRPVAASIDATIQYGDPEIEIKL